MRITTSHRENIGAAMIGLATTSSRGKKRACNCSKFFCDRRSLVVPSFQMRRGYPWLITRSLWNEVIQKEPSQTPRDFLNAHSHDIQY